MIFFWSFLGTFPVLCGRKRQRIIRLTLPFTHRLAPEILEPFPYGDRIARQCRAEADSPQDLMLLLTTRLINSVYSYGNAAPETLPAAFALAEACEADVQAAVLLANSIPKAADSLPAIVGALCGAVQGLDALSPRWQAQLTACRGLCLPCTAGVRLDDLAHQLARQE